MQIVNSISQSIRVKMYKKMHIDCAILVIKEVQKNVRKREQEDAQHDDSGDSSNAYG